MKINSGKAKGIGDVSVEMIKSVERIEAMIEGLVRLYIMYVIMLRRCLMTGKRKKHVLYLYI